MVKETKILPAIGECGVDRNQQDILKSGYYSGYTVYLKELC